VEARRRYSRTTAAISRRWWRSTAATPVFTSLGASSLNFHQAKHILLPADQIDLAAALRRREIPRHPGIALLSEMKASLFSLFLPPTPGWQVSRKIVRRQGVLRQPVEDLNRPPALRRLESAEKYRRLLC